MEGRRVAIRIIGVAPTSHGFAFALTEGPDELLDWARHGIRGKRMLTNHIDQLLVVSRPLFVACEVERNKRSGRGRELNDALKAVCERYGIMILCVERQKAYIPNGRHRTVTNYEIAQAAADQFPVLAKKLPRPRRAWNGSDDRIGVLIAAALASAGWRHFRSSP